MVATGVAAALLISFAWCLAAIKVGPVMGFVDVPDDPFLKRHDQKAVPLGGVGLMLGVTVGWLIAGSVEANVLILAGVVIVLGLIDDRVGLSPSLRLVAQAAIGVAVVAFGAVPLDFTHPLELFVATSVVVIAINAVNLFDGLDGLAGSSGAVAALGLALLTVTRGEDPAVGLVLVGALLGFLLLNRHPARVFLGDNGAYLVGLLLAVGVMRASPDGIGRDLAVAGLVLGVFLLDLSVTVLRRRLRGRPLFRGDRSHLYDRLNDRGWSVAQVVWGSIVVECGFVGLALLLEASGPGLASVLAVAAVGLALVVALAALESRADSAG